MPFRSPAGVALYDYAQAVMDGKKDVDPEGILARVLGANDEQGVMEARDFKNFFCLAMALKAERIRPEVNWKFLLLEPKSHDNADLFQIISTRTGKWSLLGLLCCWLPLLPALEALPLS